MPYSAGTIILQVVPSYVGFQDANKDMADKMAASLEQSLDKGAERGAKKAASRVNRILGEEVGKESDKAGEKAATDYAGAFRTTLQGAMRKMERELKPIELRTASSKTLDDIAAIKKEMEDLSKIKFEPGADTRKVEQSMDRISTRLKEIAKEADIDVKWDVDEANKTFDAFKKKVDSYKPKIEVKVEPEFDPKMAERQMGAFETALKKRLKAASAALGDGVDAELTKIKQRIEGLRGSEIGIDVSAAEFKRETEAIERELAHLAATTTDIHIYADAEAALAGIESVERAREKLDGKKAKVEVKAEGTQKATKDLSLFDRMMNKVGVDGRAVANSFRFFSFAALAVASAGAALIPIFAAVAGGAVAMGVALVGALAGISLLAVAFSGLGDAIGALNDQQDNATKDAEDQAKRMKNAARQVADAQRALNRAREDGAEAIEDAERALARTVEDSAQRQRDAAKRVQDAREAATRAIEQALQRQRDAEKRLADSQRDAAEAQRDLMDARKEAEKELEDLETKRRRNALDQRQAVIDLFNATVENNAAQADPGSTNLEREQADINLKNAQMRLEDLRKQQKEMDQQATKGVDNSDLVRNAQDKLTDALERQKEAQADLAQADKELTRQRLDSARDIQEALEAQRRTLADNAESISDAQRALARTREDSAQSIGDAQRALTRAQEDYQEALNQTSSSAEKVKTAMDALGPAGRDFALFIHSLRDDFREIRDIIQAAFLPPLQEAIKLVMTTYGPELKQFAGEMGKTFGEMAKLTAQFFTNKDFQTFFATIAKIAPILTRNFGTAFLTFLQAVANIAVAFAPLAVQLSEVFLEWSEAFLEWSQSKEGQKQIADFLGYLQKVGPDVARFLGVLILAVLNLAEALAPYGELLLKGITDFLQFIADMDPDALGAIAASVLIAVTAFQLLAGILTTLSIIAGSTLGLIAVAVLAVVAVFIYLYKTNDSFKKFVDRVWPVIQKVLEVAFEVWKRLMTETYNGLNMLIDAGIWLWEHVLSPFTAWLIKAFRNVWEVIGPILAGIAGLFLRIAGDVTKMWVKVVWPILKKFGEIIWNLFKAFAKPALDGISYLLGKMGDAFKWVWDKAVSPVIKAIAKAMGIDDNMKANGGGLVGVFKTAIDLIGTIWEKLKDLAKKPVDFMVNTIINKGIIGGFNALAKHLPGLDPVEPIAWPPPGYAKGGVHDKTYGVRFGYSPGRDNQIIAVGGGEAILRPEATRALGTDWVNAINKRARLFGVQGVANFINGFANGGHVPTGSRTSSAGEWDRTTWRGKKFNYHMVRLLQAVEQLTGQTLRVTQGSFSTSVAASGSTHAGGGAVDLGWPGPLLGSTLVAALRQVGIAAWHRNPSQGPWNHHIHGIAIGDPTASASARRQVQDYFAGGNGLGGKDDGPAVGKDKSLWDWGKERLSGITGWIADAITKPVEYLRSKVSASLGEITKKWGDNTFTKMLLAIPEKLMDGMASVINKGVDFITPGDGAKGPVKEIVKGLAKNLFGWEGDQWKALDWLVQHESSWNPNAQNPNSTAYGLFQFLDGTWGPYGPKTSDPALQAQYGLKYIKDRYGSPSKAKAFWEAHHWYADGGVVPGGDGPQLPDNGTMMYDNGGYLPPGVTTVVNLTGKPEPVFTAKQFEGMRGAGGSGDGLHYEPHFYNSDLTADDVMDDFRFEIRRLGRGS
jgi:phage-related protein